MLIRLLLSFIAQLWLLRCFPQSRTRAMSRHALRHSDEPSVVPELSSVPIGELDQPDIAVIGADERHAEPAGKRRVRAGSLAEAPPCRMRFELGLCEAHRAVRFAYETGDLG